jgi:hypothetical protein
MRAVNLIISLAEDATCEYRTQSSAIIVFANQSALCRFEQSMTNVLDRINAAIAPYRSAGAIAASLCCQDVTVNCGRREG